MKKKRNENVSITASPPKSGIRHIAANFRRDWILYLMILPGVLYFIIFKYGSMFGLITAFQDYNVMKGWFGSEFVGLKHFTRLFGDSSFSLIFVNTLRLAVANIVFYFPFPIMMALLINEIKFSKFKSVVQSVIYIPHFVSWVVVASICTTLFSSESGALTEMINSLFGKQISVLSSTSAFVPLITGQVIWKEFGWGTIIFLSALAAVDMQLYEAAKIDGANRWQQTWHITLPALKSVIVIQLILRMGSFLNTGFEQIFLMLNSSNRSVGEVFDTYVYNTAITSGRISYGTAVGMFKSVVSLVMVVLVNYLAKKAGEEGVY